MKHLFGLIFLSILTVVLTPENIARADTHTGNQTARIGVLAFRGVEAAKDQWAPLATYLDRSIQGWSFEIVPVTLVSAGEKIRSKELEFLITNPGHYVALSEKFGLSVLATRERRAAPEAQGLLRFGTAIFVLRSAGIETLNDLKGKSLAAVSPEAFGGFQLSWLEFNKQKIDPFKDIKSLRFMGFPQDAIVSAVQAGDVDAGIVRSGLLESLASEGRISLQDFTVLQGNDQLGYPHQVSGALYPEWPFTALPGIEKRLREKVTLALLATQMPGADTTGLRDLWSAPLSYESVRTLTTEYHLRDAPPELAPANPWGARLSMLALLATLALIAMTLSRRVKRSGAQPTTTDPEDETTVKIKSRFDTLTKREREILTMICTGEQSKAIAGKLGISPKTVEFHRSNLLHKTEAATSAQLVQLATRFGYDQGLSLGT